jgi:hypothetical protein
MNQDRTRRRVQVIQGHIIGCDTHPIITNLEQNNCDGFVQKKKVSAHFLVLILLNGKAKNQRTLVI